MSQTLLPTLDLAAIMDGMARPEARERRRARRYPLRIELHYREPEAGQSDRYGETCDISSKGIRFTVDSVPRAGATLEIALRWPLRLGDALPLRLIITGPVLRADSRGAVVLIKSFYFARAAEVDSETPPREQPIRRKASAHSME